MGTFSFHKNTQRTRVPAVIIRADKHVSRIITSGIVGMFIYGLVLPTDWQQLFGPFAQPIVWAANTVPSIEKMASASPIPELIRGFYGIGVYVLPLFALLLSLICGEFDARIRYAFSRPGWSFQKTFSFIYLVGCPAFLLCLWLYYINPMLDGVLEGNTWGSRVFINMLKYRFNLAFFGSIVTVGFSMFVWMLAIMFIGPIQLVIKGGKNVDNDL